MIKGLRILGVYFVTSILMAILATLIWGLMLGILYLLSLVLQIMLVMSWTSGRGLDQKRCGG